MKYIKCLEINYHLKSVLKIKSLNSILKLAIIFQTSIIIIIQQNNKNKL